MLQIQQFLLQPQQFNIQISMGLVPAIHKFFKNLTVSLQILGTRRGRRTSHIIRTHNYGLTCEHHCYVMLPAQ